ncbi:hypothetical protein BU15DRAFT_57051, partial [Melanogaster broomeanus]
SSSLGNIATALQTRFEQRGDGKDLDEAIKHHQSALQLRPEGQPVRRCEKKRSCAGVSLN